uniref:Fork-head domain-containing protein n=1 Tax=Acanthochromis polyacanthus TaxID=80966 RepID=A0A3Q1FFH5_9TELE
MNTEKEGPRQHPTHSSYIKEEKEGYDSTVVFETERSSMTANETTASVVDENILTNPANTSDNILSSCSKETQTFSKPSLPYIALIAKVILSSPSQKLNLSSIYRAMEEQFPYLRSRGPGWRNSVRHNLSVNECFVKVSRCEDGRGHYWGVHQAHLRDFQRGNFRQYRNPRGRRERERYNRCLTWMESSCFLRRFCESRFESLAWVEPGCPLQEPRRNQMNSLDWNQPCDLERVFLSMNKHSKCMLFPYSHTSRRAGKY